MRQLFPCLALLAVGCGVLDGSDAKESAAIVKAEQLQTCAKSYLSKHDGEKVDSLDPLVAYADDGERALLDPWGRPYQFAYVTDPGTQKDQLVIWTVVPKTGRVIAAPPHLSSQVPTTN